MGQLEAMNLFVRVVEAGGISRAAEQLGIVKSAVSRQLSDLESHLGVRLLQRTTRTQKLTAVGKEYYQRAKRIVDDVAELNASTADVNATLSGVLRIAAPLSFGLSHLASALDAFALAQPEVQLSLDFSDRHVDLVAEGFDLALRISQLKDSSLQARKLCPINLVCCASPTYLSKHPPIESPEDLATHRFLHYRGSDTAQFDFHRIAGEITTVKLVPWLEANNGDFLRDAAISGHGLVIAPTFIVWQALASGELVELLHNYRLPALHAYALYPRNRYLSVRARVFIDFLAKRFGDTPYWDKKQRPPG